MTRDRLQPGGALSGNLFQGFLKRLSDRREPRPGDQVGPYRIRTELGRGGSGVVFLAERVDGAFSQQVALKWLRGDRPVPGGREVLARERELLASLDHPHIARLIDGGESEDGQLWFAMDYVSGESIDIHAAALNLADRLRLVHAVCRAVHHAHSRGLIHGDIKPANVRIDARGRPRLLDFGIARLQSALGGGSFGLTPDYASPEQRRGEPLTTASDIWQLGRLLSEVLDGTAAPPDLSAIFRRAMAMRPDARYPSAAAMAAELDAWLGDRPVAAYGGGVGYRFGRLLRRNRAASVVAAVALLLMSGAMVWMAWQLAEERDQAQLQAERLGMLVTIAEVYLGLGQPNEALPLLEAATGLLEQGPGTALDDRARRGCLYSMHGPHSEALGEIRTSLELLEWPGFMLHQQQRKALKQEILQAGSRPQGENQGKSWRESLARSVSLYRALECTERPQCKFPESLRE